MNSSIAKLEGVLSRSGSHIAFSVPISFHDAVAAIQHDVVPQIEFPLAVKQGFLDVFLDDVGFVCTIIVFFFFLEDCLYLLKIETDDDSVASVCVLAGFDDPGIELVDRVGVAFVLFVDRVVILQEFQILVIFYAVLDVKSKW